MNYSRIQKYRSKAKVGASCFFLFFKSACNRLFLLPEGKKMWKEIEIVSAGFWGVFPLKGKKSRCEWHIIHVWARPCLFICLLHCMDHSRTMTPFNRLLRVSGSLFLYLSVVYPHSGFLSTWFLVKLEFGKVGFWGEGEVPGEQISWSKGENQQQPQPTYSVDSGVWTLATWMGGECSPNCATLAV